GRGGAGGGRADLVGQPGEHRGAGVAHVGNRSLLLRLLQSVEEVRDQQGGDDADDRYDDQQLDEREALLPVTDLGQHVRVSSPWFFEAFLREIREACRQEDKQGRCQGSTGPKL